MKFNFWLWPAPSLEPICWIWPPSYWKWCPLRTKMRLLKRVIGLLPALESYSVMSSVFSFFLNIMSAIYPRALMHPFFTTSPYVTPASLLWTQWGSVSTASPEWRVDLSHCIYTAVSKFRGLDSSCNNFCFLARIQNLDGNDKRPEQETDIISQESSVRTSTPRKNGSVLNFESPVSKGTRIQTISQSVPQTVPSTDVARPVNTTPATSISLTPAPSVSSVQKPRNNHITNR